MSQPTFTPECMAAIGARIAELSDSQTSIKLSRLQSMIERTQDNMIAHLKSTTKLQSIVATQATTIDCLTKRIKILEERNQDKHQPAPQSTTASVPKPKCRVCKDTKVVHHFDLLADRFVPFDCFQCTPRKE